MILADVWVQALIIVGVIILFLVSVILNYHIKAPKGVDVPDKCQSCASNSCMIKLSDAKKLKEELKEYLKNCEDDQSGQEDIKQ